ncbi:DoxX family protein [Microbacterium sp. KR10-403]|uniref:DoxX family protein n=1 Tax=Microbacterium sp. KR10-403 TaxID=3158581 RepID=UPI0032E50F5E
MTIALWIVNVALALAFLGAGGMKALRSKDALREGGMAWTDDFAAPVVRMIGIAEIIGAVGLILPLATGIATVLTPIAACCLAVLMIGAVVTHLRRKEKAAPALVLLILSIVSAVLGFFVALG